MDLRSNGTRRRRRRRRRRDAADAHERRKRHLSGSVARSQAGPGRIPGQGRRKKTNVADKVVTAGPARPHLLFGT
jgi:hypothetical protein